MKVGERLKSSVCNGEFVVVRAGDGTGVLTSGGEPLVSERNGEFPAVSPQEAGAEIGKRYYDEASGVEVLCTKNAAGPLAVDGVTLKRKEAKKLPSSD